MSGLADAVVHAIAMRMRWKMEPHISDDEWDLLVDSAYRPGVFAGLIQGALWHQADKDAALLGQVHLRKVRRRT